VIRNERPESLRRRASDFARDGARGWTVLGALVPDVTLDRVASLEVVGRNGRRLRLERPAASYSGRVPVVVLEPPSAIGFRMAASDVAGSPAHGEPDGPFPLAVGDVVEIRITRIPVGAPAVAPPPPGPSVPGAFTLSIGNRPEEITPDALRHEFGGATRWPLRDVVGRHTQARVARVVVRARDRDVTFDAPAWAGGEPAVLRLNRRGLMKLESSLGVARDVVAVDVTLE
jgi:hypothetical protein